MAHIKKNYGTEAAAYIKLAYDERAKLYAEKYADKIKPI